MRKCVGLVQTFTSLSLSWWNNLRKQCFRVAWWCGLAIRQRLCSLCCSCPAHSHLNPTSCCCVSPLVYSAGHAWGVRVLYGKVCQMSVSHIMIVTHRKRKRPIVQQCLISSAKLALYLFAYPRRNLEHVIMIKGLVGYITYVTSLKLQILSRGLVLIRKEGHLCSKSHMINSICANKVIMVRDDDWQQNHEPELYTWHCPDLARDTCNRGLVFGSP